MPTGPTGNGRRGPPAPTRAVRVVGADAGATVGATATAAEAAGTATEIPPSTGNGVGIGEGLRPAVGDVRASLTSMEKALTGTGSPNAAAFAALTSARA